jgi:hypothetical protein
MLIVFFSSRTINFYIEDIVFIKDIDNKAQFEITYPPEGAE